MFNANSPLNNSGLRLSCAFVFFFLTPCFAFETPDETSPRRKDDPAEALDPTRPLTPDEQTGLAALFNKFQSQNFDEREFAQKSVIDYGPQALSIAVKYQQSEDIETREFAKRLPELIALRYRGYLPPAEQLSSILEENQRVFIGKNETFDEAFRRFARSAGIQVVFDGLPSKWPGMLIGTGESVELQASAAEALQMLLNPLQLTFIPRGDRILVTTPERSAVLQIQEIRFDLSDMLLDLSGAKLLAKSLQEWLPKGTEAQAGKGEIRVYGSDASLRVAARALKLLRMTDVSIAYPSIPSADKSAAIFRILAQEVPSFKITGQEATRGIAKLRSAGFPISMDETATPLMAQQPPVTLNLTGVPLGLCLRWLSKRSVSKTIGEVSPKLVYSYGSAEPSIVANLRSGASALPVSEVVGGADTSFLYAPNSLLSAAEADKVAYQAVVLALQDNLILYPNEHDDFAMAVMNKRLLVRGSSELVAQTLAFIEKWKSTGNPPRCEWHENISRILKTKVAWNGTGLTAGTLLSRLREITNLTLMLQCDDDGKMSQFDLRTSEAGLFPAGNYSVGELLDRLGEVAHAKWSVQWGIILLSKIE